MNSLVKLTSFFYAHDDEPRWDRKWTKRLRKKNEQMAVEQIQAGSGWRLFAIFFFIHSNFSIAFSLSVCWDLFSSGHPSSFFISAPSSPLSTYLDAKCDRMFIFTLPDWSWWTRLIFINSFKWFRKPDVQHFARF